MVFHQAAVGHTLNIGSGTSVSLNAVLQEAAALVGTPANVEYRPARAGDVRQSVADVSLAQRVLGYAPDVGLRDGLARTLAALTTEKA